MSVKITQLMNVHGQKRQLSMFLLLILTHALILFHQQDSKRNFIELQKDNPICELFHIVFMFLPFEFFVYIFLLVLFSIWEWNGQERTTFRIRQVQQLLLKISSLWIQFKDKMNIYNEARLIISIILSSYLRIFPK